MNSLVSIGITAFNAQNTIEGAVASALGQSWRPLEVIVVDDCSTDGTPAILAKLAHRHPEIRLVRLKANGGVAVARNAVLEAALGEFVAFFDDDDESAPERVRLQIERIRDYERDYSEAAGRVICHTARRVIYPGGSVRIERTMGEAVGKPAPSGLAVAKRILLGTPLEDGYGACPTCSQLARSGTYRALGGFDDCFRRSEDTEFNVRLARAGGHFAGISTPLVEQRMTLTSDKSLADEFEYTRMMLDKHSDVAANPTQYRFARQWLTMRHDWLRGRTASALVGLAGLAVRHPVLTARRLMPALGMRGTNSAFARFHRQGEAS